MTPLLRNTPHFAIAQGLMVSAVSLNVTCAALVGYSLADDKSLATLPLAVMFIATMLCSIPSSLLLEKIGRKKGFMLATLIGVSAGAVASYAIVIHEFWLFVVGVGLIGVFNSVGNYFRFAAADNVTEEYKSRAISYVMLGGVVAAFVGPNLASFAKDWVIDAQFAGSYAAIIGVYIIMLLILSGLSIDTKHLETTAEPSFQPARPLSIIIRQPKFIVAVICAMLSYGVMSLVMTATPLAMMHHNHTFANTAFVIQWHLLGMFIPSFFTGYLIRHFGLFTILTTGVIIGFACVAINLMGHGLNHYWLALVLLGVCWNFLFVGGTTLLTETYRPEERAKVQGLNDFIVFSTAALASLSAGYLQFTFGWKWVNLGIIPALIIVLISLIWMKARTRQSDLGNSVKT
ncbi:MAG: MFS transporter [Cycloclasticus sp.]|jgi:MFS family permease|nr:MFS transporter [Cycloclasticus sp.]HIL91432.1 MFS transporter [Cycloclasticus sp.]